MTAEFEQLANLDAQVNELAAEHKRLLAAYRQCARELTASRKALAQRFEQAMMEQLRYLKEVICYTTHQLSDLLVIEEVEGQSLIMCKYLISHVIFHLSTHDMSLICYEEIAICLKKHKPDHQKCKL